MVKSAEEFIIEKISSQVAAFGDGTGEFHTRDINLLLDIISQKKESICILTENYKTLNKRVDLDSENRFKNLLTDVMTINNLSAEERLNSIRHEYKHVWEELCR